jgi:two-component system sensor histidine kinase SenX3
MAAAAVLAALAAVALAIATVWLVVDRRRTCARIDALTGRVERVRRDLAAEIASDGDGDAATDHAATDESLDPAADLHDPGPTAALARLSRSTDNLAEVAGLAADLRARSLRALDAIPQGVVICDISGTVIARNVEATGWVGARHGEALVQVAVDEMLADAAVGRPDRRTIELIGPPSRTVDLSAMPVIGGAVVVIDDVSERRRVDALRRDFVANISHEMRTPVGALSLLAETLLTETELLAAQPGAAVVERLAERLYHEALRLGRTIDDLLELSRIEAGEPPARDPVLVADVLAAAIDRTQPAAELREVTLHVELPDPDAATWGDRRQLVSAVANLVDNAVKYSDPGGDVEMLGEVDAAGGVRFVVRDHGIGIPEHDRDRVFERFYRVDRARRRDTGGTGLGLAIVRHVAINHGGDVEVSSREGEGSAFTLHLPPAQAGVATSTAPGTASSAPESDPVTDQPAPLAPNTRGALS